MAILDHTVQFWGLNWSSCVFRIFLYSSHGAWKWNQTFFSTVFSIFSRNSSSPNFERKSKAENTFSEIWNERCSKEEIQSKDKRNKTVAAAADFIVFYFRVSTLSSNFFMSQRNSLSYLAYFQFSSKFISCLITLIDHRVVL